MEAEVTPVAATHNILARIIRSHRIEIERWTNTWSSCDQLKVRRPPRIECTPSGKNWWVWWSVAHHSVKVPCMLNYQIECLNQGGVIMTPVWRIIPLMVNILDWMLAQRKCINNSGMAHQSMDACRTLAIPSVGATSWIECLPNGSELITLVWCIIPWILNILDWMLTQRKCINNYGVAHHSMDACHTLAIPSVGATSWIECLPNGSELITPVWCIIPWILNILDWMLAQRKCINNSGVAHHSMDACHKLAIPSVGATSWIECFLPNGTELITPVWCIIPWMLSIHWPLQVWMIACPAAVDR